MGIKGIYKEIGSGQRISLCKLAIDHLEQSGRPLRLAIDFSIWQFQVQAARGGSNPAIRTLFYRLVRLLGLAIEPIFVFDGPNKPAFKRNKRSGRGDGVATAMAKRLIRLFGFATHDAPGEAEAECALLEQQGVVDAVLSEDVDTIMFGCRRTLRNWSAEGAKGSKTPTHVSMYDAAAVAAGASGLDREGMVLVALMSGGDYLPEGVPGCGVKVACEAAKAGFGRDLCRIKRADRDALTAWKTRLLRELRTNESGFFRTRHKALDIPDSFPNLEVLGYYTHPVVSRQTTVDRLKREFPPAKTVDLVGLREFAGETFDWEFRIGAVKLIRVLAPSLLVQRLAQRFLDRYVSAEAQYDDLVLMQKEESALVKAISSKRAHFSTDATPELRVSFIPVEIVKLDLDAEPEEEVEAFGRSGIALNSDDEFDDEAPEEVGGEQPKTASSKKPFDPLQPDLVWIPETLAKLGVPLTVEDWEGKQRMKGQGAAAKAPRKTRVKVNDMPAGALDKYVKVTKSIANTSKDSVGPQLDSLPLSINSQCSLSAPKTRSKQLKKSSTATQAGQPAAGDNPWTLARSQISPRAAKSTTSSSSQVQRKSGAAHEPILISSSPVAPSPRSPPGAGLTFGETTPTRGKRLQSPAVGNCSPIPLFNLPPSPGNQSRPAAQKPTEEDPATATQSTQPTRKARLFKRVKSGAEDNIGTTMAQKSIKDFGRVLKSVSSSQANNKTNPAPIELPSDDDDDFPLPRFKPPPKGPLGRNNSLPRASSVNTDDDPFGPAPTLHRPADPTGAQLPSRNKPTKEMGQQHHPQHAKVSARESENKTINKTTTAPKSATTKLYIPRQSLTGLGYFTEVEVSREEAELMTAANDNLKPGSGQELGKGKRPSRRAWRQSEIVVLDLTGED